MIVDNTHGSTCYGLSHAGMVSWIRDFSNTYHSKTGRYPTIYTSTSWWNTCTGGSKAFGKTNPLMVARYSSSVGTLPAGWSYVRVSLNKPGSYSYAVAALIRSGSMLTMVRALVIRMCSTAAKRNSSSKCDMLFG